MTKSVSIDLALKVVTGCSSSEQFPSAVSFPHGQRFYTWSRLDGVYRIFTAGKLQLLKCPGDIFPFHSHEGRDVLLDMTKLSVQALDAWRVVGTFTTEEMREAWMRGD